MAKKIAVSDLYLSTIPPGEISVQNLPDRGDHGYKKVSEDQRMQSRSVNRDCLVQVGKQADPRVTEVASRHRFDALYLNVADFTDGVNLEFGFCAVD